MCTTKHGQTLCLKIPLIVEGVTRGSAAPLFLPQGLLEQLGSEKQKGMLAGTVARKEQRVVVLGGRGSLVTQNALHRGTGWPYGLVATVASLGSERTL